MAERINQIRIVEATELSDQPQPGDLLHFPPHREQQYDRWTMVCPACGRGAALSDHTIEFSGGIVTVSPSLICPRDNCQAHYWIKSNKIEWC